jgi:hypothetical protein
MARLSPSDLG